MFKNPVQQVGFLFLLAGFAFGWPGHARGDSAATNQIGQGVLYYRYQYNSLYSAKQNTYVVDVNLNDPATGIRFPYLTGGALRTVTAHTGTVSNAIAAVNGQFFTTNGSICHLRVNGTTINPSASGVQDQQALVDTGTGKANSIGLVSRPSGGWPALNVSNILACGPQLLTDGVKRTNYATNDTLITTRNPRTCAAWTYDNHLLIIVVDGRSAASAGMTIPELRDYVATLGSIRYAFNLDGGGSSAMWTLVNGTGSIKNIPSDGVERSVADAVVITAPPPAVPGVPQNLAATAVTNKISLTWSTVSGAITYRIWRALVNASFQPYALSAGIAYTDTNVSIGVTYRYVVTATNYVGESAGSGIALATVPCGTISAPGNLMAQTQNRQIVLSWTPATGASGYTILRGTSMGGPYAALASLANTNQYADLTAEPAVIYFYRVAATNACGTAVNSTEASAPLQFSPLMAGTNMVLAGWGGQPGATYYMEATTNLSGPWTRLITNTYGSSGAFSVTLPVDPTVRGRFFRITEP